MNKKVDYHILLIDDTRFRNKTRIDTDLFDSDLDLDLFDLECDLRERDRDLCERLLDLDCDLRERELDLRRCER